MTTQEILQGVHDWTNGKIVYDISVAHPDGQGNPTKYANLTAALGTGGANIPETLRKGGMSVKFVLSSDNKYVQYRLMSDTFNTTVANWQGVASIPTANSKDLIDSGSVYGVESNIKYYDLTTNQYVKYLYPDTVNKTITIPGFRLKTGGHLRLKLSSVNTAQNPTLNISDTGAYPIYYNNAPLSAKNTWNSGDIVDAYFDGETWKVEKVVTYHDIDLISEKINDWFENGYDVSRVELTHNATDGYISSTGVYKIATGFSGLLYDVSSFKGKYLKIHINNILFPEHSSAIAFLKNNTLVENEIPNYSDRLFSIVNINTDEIYVKLPQDCNYIWLYSNRGNYAFSFVFYELVSKFDRVDSEFDRVDSEIDSINKQLFIENNLQIQLNELPHTNGYISSDDGEFHNAGENYYGVLVDVSIYTNTKLKFVPSPNTSPQSNLVSSYAFLTDDTLVLDDTPNYAGGFSKPIELTNNPTYVVVPNDAKYMWVYTKRSSNIAPDLFVLSTDKNKVESSLPTVLGVYALENEEKSVFIENGINNSVVFNGLNLTDIFEKNNLLQIAPGFESGSYYPLTVNHGNPVITNDEKFAGKYSLFINDVETQSSNIVRLLSGTGTYFCATKIKVTSYTNGCAGILISTDEAGRAVLRRTTDGWETVAKICSKQNGHGLFVGGADTSELVAYIDYPVIIPMSLFDASVTEDVIKSWYERYLAYRQSTAVIQLATTNYAQEYVQEYVQDYMQGESFPDESCYNRFVLEMNKRAARIGMASTTFYTPSGLGTRPGIDVNVSTAKDMIKLMIEAMSCPKLMKVWGKASWDFNYYDASAGIYTTKTLESTVTNPNHNTKLAELLQYCNILGGKTGTIAVNDYTTFNYCVVAEKDGKYVIGVVFDALNGDYRYYKMTRLLRNGFGLLNDPSFTTYDINAKCACCEVPNIEPSMLQDFTPTLLYAEDEDVQVNIASTSKIMTGILTSELLELNQKLLYKQFDDIGGSGDDLDNGDIATFEEMLMDTMLPSSNGCATCIGRVAGSKLLNYESMKAI